MANTTAATVPPSRSLPRSSKAAVGASCKLRRRQSRKKFITSRPFTSGPFGPGIDAVLDTVMNAFVPRRPKSLG